MSNVILTDESCAIVGACFEVYNEKGSGFLEPIYQDCLEIEFGLRGIPFVREPMMGLSHKGVSLPRRYSPDFVCWDKIVVELKACDQLADEHVAQVMNYLNASRFALGLLVNFGHYPKLEYRRVVRTKSTGSDSSQFA